MYTRRYLRALSLSEPDVPAEQDVDLEAAAEAAHDDEIREPGSRRSGD
jgi:hypothetical protein